MYKLSIVAHFGVSVLASLLIINKDPDCMYLICYKSDIFISRANSQTCIALSSERQAIMTRAPSMAIHLAVS